jgi:hypothetical protein
LTVTKKTKFEQKLNMSFSLHYEEGTQQQLNISTQMIGSLNYNATQEQQQATFSQVMFGTTQENNMEDDDDDQVASEEEEEEIVVKLKPRSPILYFEDPPVIIKNGEIVSATTKPTTTTASNTKSLFSSTGTTIPSEPIKEQNHSLSDVIEEATDSMVAGLLYEPSQSEIMDTDFSVDTSASKSAIISTESIQLDDSDSEPEETTMITFEPVTARTKRTTQHSSPPPAKRQKLDLNESTPPKTPSLHRQMVQLEANAREEAKKELFSITKGSNNINGTPVVSRKNNIRKRRMKSPSSSKKSDIFSGFSFMFTMLSKREKDTLTERIIDNGGKIIEKEDLVDSSDLLIEAKIILLAKECSASLMYLIALDLEIPLLTISWFEQCIETGSIVLPKDSDQLPCFIKKKEEAPIVQTTLEIPETMNEFLNDYCTSSTVENRMFYKKRFFIHGDETFKSDTSLLLKYSGAKIVHRIDADDPPHYILVQEDSFETDVVDVPQVTTQFIKESIQERELQPVENYATVSVPFRPSARTSAAHAKKKKQPKKVEKKTTSVAAPSNQKKSKKSEKNKIEKKSVPAVDVTQQISNHELDGSLESYYVRYNGQKFFIGDPVQFKNSQNKGIILSFKQSRELVECKYQVLKYAPKFCLTKNELLYTSNTATVDAEYLEKLDVLEKFKHSTNYYCIRRLHEDQVEDLLSSEQPWTVQNSESGATHCVGTGGVRDEHRNWTQYSKLSYTSTSVVTMNLKCGDFISLSTYTESALKARVDKILNVDNVYKLWLTRLTASAKRERCLISAPEVLLIPVSQVLTCTLLDVVEITGKELDRLKNLNPDVFYLIV